MYVVCCFCAHRRVPRSGVRIDVLVFLGKFPWVYLLCVCAHRLCCSRGVFCMHAIHDCLFAIRDYFAVDVSRGSVKKEKDVGY